MRYALPLLIALCVASIVRADSRVLFDPGTFDAAAWQHMTFGADTAYGIESAAGRLALAARAARPGAASGFMREVDIDLALCSTLAWSWRVTLVQMGADIARKSADDVAASLFLMFGEPGLLGAARRVPTLRYVWTGGPQGAGAVVDSPYLPGVVRNLVVADASSPLGPWREERRDILADARAAFPGLATMRLHAVAVYTDNDQTGQPVEAFYGPIRMDCDG